MGELDVTFRQLLRALPRPVLRLAFPGHKLRPLGPIDPSVDRARPLTTDNLFRVHARTGDAVVHVEIEREWRADLPPRLFDYATAGASMTRSPISTVVVLLRPGGKAPQGTGVHCVPGIVGDSFVFRYHVVPLWQLDARSMRARLGLEAAPFCVAMRGADEDFVLSLIKEVRTARTISQHARDTLLRLLYNVSAVVFGATAARRIFNMLEWMWDDPDIREFWREALEKGQIEGIAKGRAEATRTALCTVLGARSLPVTRAVRSRIKRETDVARLQAWVATAVNADTLDEVFRPVRAGRRQGRRRRAGSRRPAPPARGRAARPR